MKRIILYFGLILISTLQFASAEPISAIGPCLSVRGILKSVETFGPPNYGENPATDARMKSWILTLKHPIRAKVRDADAHLHIVSDLREVQVITSGAPPDNLSGEGKLTSVSGCLYFAESGHHVTRVFLDLGAK
jgi:hypothetical protein